MPTPASSMKPPVACSTSAEGSLRKLGFDHTPSAPKRASSRNRPTGSSTRASPPLAPSSSQAPEAELRSRARPSSPPTIVRPQIANDAPETIARAGQRLDVNRTDLSWTLRAAPISASASTPPLSVGERTFVLALRQNNDASAPAMRGNASPNPDRSSATPHCRGEDCIVAPVARRAGRSGSGGGDGSGSAARLIGGAGVGSLESKLSATATASASTTAEQEGASAIFWSVSVRESLISLPTKRAPSRSIDARKLRALSAGLAARAPGTRLRISPKNASAVGHSAGACSSSRTNTWRSALCAAGGALSTASVNEMPSARALRELWLPQIERA